MKKNCKFYQKTSISRKVKLLKSIETKNHAVTFYQNLEGVFSHLRTDEYQKLTKTLGNLKKIADLIKKMLKFETLKSEKAFQCY